MTTAADLVRPVATLDVPASERWAADEIHRNLVAALGLPSSATWPEVIAAAKVAGRRPSDDEIADWLETHAEAHGNEMGREALAYVARLVRSLLGPRSRSIR